MTTCKKCDHCDSTDETVKRYRQNTQYVHEESNWVTLCRPCRQENDAYWQERWDDYYSGRL